MAVSEIIIVRENDSIVINHRTGEKRHRGYTLGLDQVAFAIVGAISMIPFLLGVLTILFHWDPVFLFIFTIQFIGIWILIIVSRGR